MSALPAKTAISDVYPNPSNATARAGFGALHDAINEFTEKSEIDVASAATCDIGAQLSTKLKITGTTGITSFGTTYRGPIWLRFAGAVTLTHNATTLRCPGGANITTAAGDILIAYPTATVSGTPDGWQVVGSAGEYISSTIVGGSSVALSGTQKNVTSISLTAGDWEVGANVLFAYGSTTSVTMIQGSISQTSNTLDSNVRFSVPTAAFVPGLSIPMGHAVPTARLSLSSTTTVYLVAYAEFTVSTMSAYGTIWARRIR